MPLASVPLSYPASDCIFLAIGIRIDDDACDYPDIDMKTLPESNDRPGTGTFVHKDGTPY